MTIVASPIGAPVEAAVVAPLQVFFETGPQSGHIESAFTLVGVGASTAASGGAASTALTPSAVGENATP